MLPKIALPLEESLVLEDHLNDLMFRYKNQNYHKLKAKHMPRPYDTPFGNFPKESPNKRKNNKNEAIIEEKNEENRKNNVFSVNKNKDFRVLGKKQSYVSEKRIASEPSPLKKSLKLPKIKNNRPFCGAFEPRDISFSEFRKYFHFFPLFS